MTELEAKNWRQLSVYFSDFSLLISIIRTRWLNILAKIFTILSNNLFRSANCTDKWSVLTTLETENAACLLSWCFIKRKIIEFLILKQTLALIAQLSFSRVLLDKTCPSYRYLRVYWLTTKNFSSRTSFSEQKTWDYSLIFPIVATFYKIL